MEPLSVFLRVSASFLSGHKTGGAIVLIPQERLGKGLWLLSFGSRTVVAKTELVLTPGVPLRLRIASRDGQSVVLKPVSPPEISSNLPSISLSELQNPPPALVQALLRTGFPLRPETLQTLTRLGKGLAPDDRERWRLLVLLESKGLLVSELRENLESVLPAGPGADKGHQDRSTPDFHRDGKAEGRESSPKRSEPPMAADEAESSKIVLPQGEQALDPVDSVGLFNLFRAGRGGHWFFLPFEARDGQALRKGLGRFHWDDLTNRVVEWTFAIDGDPAEIFSLAETSGRRVLKVLSSRILTPGKSYKAAALEEILGSMGLDLKVVLGRSDSFDGFDDRMLPAAGFDGTI